MRNLLLIFVAVSSLHIALGQTKTKSSNIKWQANLGGTGIGLPISFTVPVIRSKTNRKLAEYLTKDSKSENFHKSSSNTALTQHMMSEVDPLVVPTGDSIRNNEKDMKLLETTKNIKSLEIKINEELAKKNNQPGGDPIPPPISVKPLDISSLPSNIPIDLLKNGENVVTKTVTKTKRKDGTTEIRITTTITKLKNPVSPSDKLSAKNVAESSPTSVKKSSQIQSKSLSRATTNNVKDRISPESTKISGKTTGLALPRVLSIKENKMDLNVRKKSAMTMPVTLTTGRKETVNSNTARATRFEIPTTRPERRRKPPRPPRKNVAEIPDVTKTVRIPPRRKIDMEKKIKLQVPQEVLNISEEVNAQLPKETQLLLNKLVNTAVEGEFSNSGNTNKIQMEQQQIYADLLASLTKAVNKIKQERTVTESPQRIQSTGVQKVTKEMGKISRYSRTEKVSNDITSSRTEGTGVVGREAADISNSRVALPQVKVDQKTVDISISNNGQNNIAVSRKSSDILSASRVNQPQVQTPRQAKLGISTKSEIMASDRPVTPSRKPITEIVDVNKITQTQSKTPTKKSFAQSSKQSFLLTKEEVVKLTKPTKPRTTEGTVIYDRTLVNPSKSIQAKQIGKSLQDVQSGSGDTEWASMSVDMTSSHVTDHPQYQPSTAQSSEWTDIAHSNTPQIQRRVGSASMREQRQQTNQNPPQTSRDQWVIVQSTVRPSWGPGPTPVPDGNWAVMGTDQKERGHSEVSDMNLVQSSLAPLEGTAKMHLEMLANNNVGSKSSTFHKRKKRQTPANIRKKIERIVSIRGTGNVQTYKGFTTPSPEKESRTLAPRWPPRDMKPSVWPTLAPVWPYYLAGSGNNRVNVIQNIETQSGIPASMWVSEAIDPNIALTWNGASNWDPRTSSTGSDKFTVGESSKWSMSNDGSSVSITDTKFSGKTGDVNFGTGIKAGIQKGNTVKETQYFKDPNSAGVSWMDTTGVRKTGFNRTETVVTTETMSGTNMGRTVDLGSGVNGGSRTESTVTRTSTSGNRVGIGGEGSLGFGSSIGSAIPRSNIGLTGGYIDYSSTIRNRGSPNVIDQRTGTVVGSTSTDFSSTLRNTETSNVGLSGSGNSNNVWNVGNRNGGSQRGDSSSMGSTWNAADRRTETSVESTGGPTGTGSISTTWNVETQSPSGSIGGVSGSGSQNVVETTRTEFFNVNSGSAQNQGSTSANLGINTGVQSNVDTTREVIDAGLKGTVSGENYVTVQTDTTPGGVSRVTKTFRNPNGNVIKTITTITIINETKIISADDYPQTTYVSTSETTTGNTGADINTGATNLGRETVVTETIRTGSTPINPGRTTVKKTVTTGVDAIDSGIIIPDTPSNVESSSNIDKILERSTTTTNVNGKPMDILIGGDSSVISETISTKETPVIIDGGQNTLVTETVTTTKEVIDPASMSTGTSSTANNIQIETQPAVDYSGSTTVSGAASTSENSRVTETFTSRNIDNTVPVNTGSGGTIITETITETITSSGSPSINVGDTITTETRGQSSSSDQRTVTTSTSGGKSTDGGVAVDFVFIPPSDNTEIKTVTTGNVDAGIGTSNKNVVTETVVKKSSSDSNTFNKMNVNIGSPAQTSFTKTTTTTTEKDFSANFGNFGKPRQTGNSQQSLITETVSSGSTGGNLFLNSKNGNRVVTESISNTQSNPELNRINAGTVTDANIDMTRLIDSALKRNDQSTSSTTTTSYVLPDGTGSRTVKITNITIINYRGGGLSPEIQQRINYETSGDATQSGTSKTLFAGNLEGIPIPMEYAPITRKEEVITSTNVDPPVIIPAKDRIRPLFPEVKPVMPVVDPIRPIVDMTPPVIDPVRPPVDPVPNPVRPIIDRPLIEPPLIDPIPVVEQARPIVTETDYIAPPITTVTKTQITDSQSRVIQPVVTEIIETTETITSNTGSVQPSVDLTANRGSLTASTNVDVSKSNVVSGTFNTNVGVSETNVFTDTSSTNTVDKATTVDTYGSTDTSVTDGGLPFDVFIVKPGRSVTEVKSNYSDIGGVVTNGNIVEGTGVKAETTNVVTETFTDTAGDVSRGDVSGALTTESIGLSASTKEATVGRGISSTASMSSGSVENKVITTSVGTSSNVLDAIAEPRRKIQLYKPPKQISPTPSLVEEATIVKKTATVTGDTGIQTVVIPESSISTDTSSSSFSTDVSSSGGGTGTSGQTIITETIITETITTDRQADGGVTSGGNVEVATEAGLNVAPVIDANESRSTVSSSSEVTGSISVPSVTTTRTNSDAAATMKISNRGSTADSIVDQAAFVRDTVVNTAENIVDSASTVVTKPVTETLVDTSNTGGEIISSSMSTSDGGMSTNLIGGSNFSSSTSFSNNQFRNSSWTNYTTIKGPSGDSTIIIEETVIIENVASGDPASVSTESSSTSSVSSINNLETRAADGNIVLGGTTSSKNDSFVTMETSFTLDSNGATRDATSESTRMGLMSSSQGSATVNKDVNINSQATRSATTNVLETSRASSNVGLSSKTSSISSDTSKTSTGSRKNSGPMADIIILSGSTGTNSPVSSESSGAVEEIITTVTEEVVSPAEAGASRSSTSIAKDGSVVSKTVEYIDAGTTSTVEGGTGTNLGTGSSVSVSSSSSSGSSDNKPAGFATGLTGRESGANAAVILVKGQDSAQQGRVITGQSGVSGFTDITGGFDGSSSLSSSLSPSGSTSSFGNSNSPLLVFVEPGKVSTDAQTSITANKMLGGTEVKADTGNFLNAKTVSPDVNGKGLTVSGYTKDFMETQSGMLQNDIRTVSSGTSLSSMSGSRNSNGLSSSVMMTSSSIATKPDQVAMDTNLEFPIKQMNSKLDTNKGDSKIENVHYKKQQPHNKGNGSKIVNLFIDVPSTIHLQNKSNTETKVKLDKDKPTSSALSGSVETSISGNLRSVFSTNSGFPMQPVVQQSVIGSKIFETTSLDTVSLDKDISSQSDLKRKKSESSQSNPQINLNLAMTPETNSIKTMLRDGTGGGSKTTVKANTDEGIHGSANKVITAVGGRMESQGGEFKTNVNGDNRSLLAESQHSLRNLESSKTSSATGVERGNLDLNGHTLLSVKETQVKTDTLPVLESRTTFEISPGELDSMVTGGLTLATAEKMLGNTEAREFKDYVEQASLLLNSFKTGKPKVPSERKTRAIAENRMVEQINNMLDVLVSYFKKAHNKTVPDISKLTSQTKISTQATVVNDGKSVENPWNDSFGFTRKSTGSDAFKSKTAGTSIDIASKSSAESNVKDSQIKAGMKQNISLQNNTVKFKKMSRVKQRNTEIKTVSNEMPASVKSEVKEKMRSKVKPVMRFEVKSEIRTDIRSNTSAGTRTNTKPEVEPGILTRVSSDVAAKEKPEVKSAFSLDSRSDISVKTDTIPTFSNQNSTKEIQATKEKSNEQVRDSEVTETFTLKSSLIDIKDTSIVSKQKKDMKPTKQLTVETNLKDVNANKNIESQIQLDPTDGPIYIDTTYVYEYVTQTPTMDGMLTIVPTTPVPTTTSTTTTPRPTPRPKRRKTKKVRKIKKKIRKTLIEDLPKPLPTTGLQKAAALFNARKVPTPQPRTTTERPFFETIQGDTGLWMEITPTANQNQDAWVSGNVSNQTIDDILIKANLTDLNTTEPEVTSKPEVAARNSSVLNVTDVTSTSVSSGRSSSLSVPDAPMTGLGLRQPLSQGGTARKTGASGTGMSNAAMGAFLAILTPQQKLQLQTLLGGGGAPAAPVTPKPTPKPTPAPTTPAPRPPDFSALAMKMMQSLNGKNAPTQEQLQQMMASIDGGITSGMSGNQESNAASSMDGNNPLSAMMGGPSQTTPDGRPSRFGDRMSRMRRLMRENQGMGPMGMMGGMNPMMRRMLMRSMRTGGSATDPGEVPEQPAPGEAAGGLNPMMLMALGGGGGGGGGLSSLLSGGGAGGLSSLLGGGGGGDMSALMSAMGGGAMGGLGGGGGMDMAAMAQAMSMMNGGGGNPDMGGPASKAQAKTATAEKNTKASSKTTKSTSSSGSASASANPGSGTDTAMDAMLNAAMAANMGGGLGMNPMAAMLNGGGGGGNMAAMASMLGMGGMGGMGGLGALAALGGDMPDVPVRRGGMGGMGLGMNPMAALMGGMVKRSTLNANTNDGGKSRRRKAKFTTGGRADPKPVDLFSSAFTPVKQEIVGSSAGEMSSKTASTNPSRVMNNTTKSQDAKIQDLISTLQNPLSNMALQKPKSSAIQNQIIKQFPQKSTVVGQSLSPKDWTLQSNTNKLVKNKKFNMMQTAITTPVPTKGVPTVSTSSKGSPAGGIVDKMSHKIGFLHHAMPTHTMPDLTSMFGMGMMGLAADPPDMMPELMGMGMGMGGMGGIGHFFGMLNKGRNPSNNARGNQMRGHSQQRQPLPGSHSSQHGPSQGQGRPPRGHGGPPRRHGGQHGGHSGPHGGGTAGAMGGAGTPGSFESLMAGGADTEMLFSSIGLIPDQIADIMGGTTRLASNMPMDIKMKAVAMRQSGMTPDQIADSLGDVMQARRATMGIARGMHLMGSVGPTVAGMNTGNIGLSGMRSGGMGMRPLPGI